MTVVCRMPASLPRRVLHVLGGDPVGQGDPRDADVAIDKCLAGHPVAGRQVLLGQVLALLVLHRIGVLQSRLNPAATGTANAAAALERNASLLADREPQQVAVLRPGDHLVAVGDEGDADHRGSCFTRAMSVPPEPASDCSSSRAAARVSNFGRNLDGTWLTTGGPDSSTMRVFASRRSFAMTNCARLRPQNR